MAKSKTIEDIKKGKGLSPLQSNSTNNKPSGVTKNSRQLGRNGIRTESFSLDRKPSGVTRVQNHKKSTSTSKKENKPKEATSGE